MKINKRVVPHTGSWVLSLTAALAVLPAAAFEFSSGELTGSFDTTVSAGGAWRMENRDPSLVGITNGGTSRSVNEDDGNLNYDKGDAVFGILKATTDLELNYKDYGAFFRGSYFYDHVNDNKDELTPEARDIAGSDAKMLDAYVRGKFALGDRSLNLRLGAQVVSWGESTFIPNGINVINPVDLSKLRAPGAELKEALIPSPMLWVAQELTEQTTVEGLLLTDFDKTLLEPRGTFFSSNDFISDGGDKAYIGFGRRKDQHFPLSSPITDPEAAVWIPRAADRNPSDHGQYGVAIRQFAPSLNNTEFALYHVNYHSRTPIATGIRGTPSNMLAAGSARYFVEYPENIKLYGLSFNTSAAAGIALQGEYSYRPNHPLQLSAIELLLAGLGAANNITGGAASAAAVPVGTEISGYRRVQMHQAQFTATKAFGPTWGAEQLALVGEAGYTYLNLPDGLLFNGPGTYLPAPGSSTATSGGSSQPNGDGYTTKDSWGYRLLARLDFPNAIGTATLSPRLAFSHDVNGVGPSFNEGVMAATLGLGLSFKERWQTDLSYTSFFGGRNYSGTDPAGAPAGTTQSANFSSSTNPLKDRDFLALSVSYSF